ncbi:MAG: FtsX-like permease family protein [Burkholderiales bacterium]
MTPANSPPPSPARATGLHLPGILRLAARQLLRDLRSGELKLLLVAVTLAVAALTAVAFFADRLQAGLSRDARTMLGGDLVVASDQPLPAAFTATARSMGLATVQTATFASIARAPDERGGAARLVAVKAASAGYPLRGQLQVNDAPGAPTRAAQSGPAPGQAWVDPSVLDTLQLRVGDALLLGDARLRIGALIALEPDRGAGFMSFAPRVLIHADDLPATGLIQPASRVTWRLALAGRGGRGADNAVQGFAAWAQSALDTQHVRGARIESLDTGRPEMRQTLERAELFLRLVAILAALLAAVAVGIAAHGFALRHLDSCAMLRVLGLPQRRIAAVYVGEFVLVGLVASLLGVLLGLALHQVFVSLLAGLLDANLPPPGLRPVGLGLGVGLCLLMAFGLPPVLQLARVPALRVLRRELGEPAAASIGVLLTGLAGFAALMLLAAGESWLGGIAVGGFALAWGVFALCAWGAVQALRRGVPELSAPRWLLLATRQLTARPALAVLQVSALALGLTALGLLVLLRTDLIDSWRAATPPDAPNRFVINVMPEQNLAFQTALRNAGVAKFDWYPMIRGRLVAINTKEVRSDAFAEARARNLVEREFNLSHSAVLPGHNLVTAGRWTPDEADALSVEQGLAETLGLKLGDRLRFDVAGTVVEGRITSLRKVDWASMRVNFFVLLPRARLDGLPLSYISALRAPAVSAAKPSFDSLLAREFPNLTVVDISAQLAQVQRVLDQVIRAVEFLFAFTLATGLTVLFGTIGITRQAREQEFALMRAMGASSRLLRAVQRAELAGIGALAGTLAAVAALAIGWALARYVFNFDWRPPYAVPLLGALIGAALAYAAGWWSLRGVMQRPVTETLRRATGE